MKTKYLLLFGLMCICFNINAQLIIPKKKCTRGKCYFTDQTNKRISDYYESVKPFKEGLGAVQLDGKWGYVNDTMELVIPIIYKRATKFKEGLAAVKLDNQFYLINQAEEIKSEKYDSISYFGNYILIKENNKYGLLALDGTLKEAPKFDRVSSFYNNDFGVEINGKWANYNNGNLNYDNTAIYFSNPEIMPVFNKICVNSEDLDSRLECSNKEMLAKIYQSVRYPSEARDKDIQGTVVIRFLINKDGLMENPEILENVGGGCGEEALSVASTYLKKWALPGMDNGETVNTLFCLPISFLLD